MRCSSSVILLLCLPICNGQIDTLSTTEFKGTLLADGTFTTRTSVSEQADIALDIRDMGIAINDNSDYITARNIYLAGSNSLVYDKAGNVLPYKRTIQTLSTDPTLFNGMTYIFHLFGLAGGNSQSLGGANALQRYRNYSDGFILSKFNDLESSALGLEAIVALTMWMYVTHEVWDSIADCADAVDSSLSSSYTLTNNENSARSFDTAMAYYVGSGQEAGSTNGHSLYALAQKAATKFDTLDSGMAIANEKMRVYFEIGSIDLSVENACETQDRFSNLWTISNLMVNAMTIPLIQMLIAAMIENDAERVKLYALSIVPQMSVCKESSYRKIKEALLDKPFNANFMTDILTELQSMYSCLGVTCEDIGAYRDEQGNIKVARCADIPVHLPLAGYTPTTYIHEMNQMDLDAQQISFLVNLEKNKYAEYIYRHGKNAHMLDISDQTFRSLQSYATYDQREHAHFFSLFVDYFNDKRYADTRILKILNNELWDTPIQRSKAIAVSLQYQLLFMAILAELSDAIMDCESKDKSKNIDVLSTVPSFGRKNSWDEVATLLIGSLEGPAIGGAPDINDGRFFYHLNNKRCSEFQVCNEEEYSAINNEMLNLLYAGQAQMNVHDCENLARTVRQISHLLLIPLIQSLIHYAVANQQLPMNSNEAILAEGEEFALAILPILATVHPVAASLIESNMIARVDTKPVESGAERVGDALYVLLKEFMIKCKYVGVTEGGIDACTDEAVRAETFASSKSSSSRIVIGGSSAFIGFALFSYFL